MNLKDYVATIPNFPKEGILFRDITPAMLNGKAFKKRVMKWWHLLERLVLL